MIAAGLLKNKKVLAGSAFTALLLAVALWPSATPADFGYVSRGALRVTVDEEGETRVRDRFVVSAPVPGRVLRVHLEPGDMVEKGRTIVATFLPAPPAPLDARSRAEAEAAVAAARATLGQAQAQQRRAAAALELARAELQRMRELAEGQVASRQAVELAQAAEREAAQAHQAAEYAVAAAEHQLGMAQARLLHATGAGSAQPLRILAPVDGTVLRRHRESEAVVLPGEPLLELGDARRLEIVADLLSHDAVRVRAGQAVLVDQWGGERLLHARVRRVEPSGFMKVSALGVEEQRVNVVMDFEGGGEWRELGDGFRVEVHIVVWEQDDTLKVPTSALFRRGEQWAVFAVEGGRARLRTIEVGRRSGLETEVLSGLSEGVRVVVHPGDTLQDGSRVVARAS